MTHPDHPLSGSPAERQAGEIINTMRQALAAAVKLATPETPDKSPLEVFPEPGERRADTLFPVPPGNENGFREVIGSLGPGRETNQNATELGLSAGYVADIEGGQMHKIITEIKLVIEDKQTPPSVMIVSATPKRTIPPVGEKVGERDKAAQILGIPADEIGATEYDAARQVIQKTPGFVPAEQEVVMAYGYTMDGELCDPSQVPPAAEGEPQHQFVHMGHIEIKDKVTVEGGEDYEEVVATVPVILMRADREYFEDGKYKPLGVTDTIRVTEQLARAEGKIAPEIAFVTSATYLPSRRVDQINAMKQSESRYGVENASNVSVLTYGSKALAQTRMEQSYSPSLGQLAGEANWAAQQIVVLENLLGQKQDQSD